jgi:F-type H+-transporting ATPase subunit b
MENIGVDPKLLLAQLINFGLFFFLYQKFVAGPFVKTMSDEKRKDEERKKLADLMASQKEMLSKEEKSAREEIRRKTEESLKAVHSAAEAERVMLMKKAKDESEQLIKKASKQIEEEKAQMEQTYKDALAKVSVMTVEHALKDYLTEDMQKQINARILTNLTKK